MNVSYEMIVTEAPCGQNSTDLSGSLHANEEPGILRRFPLVGLFWSPLKRFS